MNFVKIRVAKTVRFLTDLTKITFFLYTVKPYDIFTVRIPL
jgi:hypothetical protein